MDPTVSAAVPAGAGVALDQWPSGALLTIGGCALGLLLLGVRNAWDTVTFVVTEGHQGSSAPTPGA